MEVAQTLSTPITAVTPEGHGETAQTRISDRDKSSNIVAGTDMLECGGRTQIKNSPVPFEVANTNN